VSVIGDPSSRVRVLVVGCIHGNEPAGIDIANALARSAPLPGVAVWVVTTLNPDGVARGTRQNARGVDLNRNFAYRWQPGGVPFSLNYSGSGPLSEPEADAAGALIQHVHPTLAIWFHQAAALVDDSEGPRAAEELFSRLVGLPLRAMTDYPGSAVGWENHLFGATAFVVELPGGRLTAAQVGRYVDAIRAVSRVSLTG
jgi:murein peptide amidase A